jgi:hypothetical protein
LTDGGSATPEPLDLAEISRSGDLFDALAARHVRDPGSGAPFTDDPAVRLLAALVADVDMDAPPLPAPSRGVSYSGAKTSGRPVVRAFVTFGAVTVLLTTSGAAVAGGGREGPPKGRAPSADLRVSERSNARLEAISRPAPGGARPSPAAPKADATADPSPRASATKTSHAPTRGSAKAPGAGLTERPPPDGALRGGQSPSPTATPTPTSSAPPSPDASPTPSPTPRPLEETTTPHRRSPADDRAPDSHGPGPLQPR